MKMLKMSLSEKTQQFLFEHVREFDRTIDEDGTIIREHVVRLTTQERPGVRESHGIFFSDFFGPHFNCVFQERKQCELSLGDTTYIFTALCPDTSDEILKDTVWTDEEIQEFVNERIASVPAEANEAENLVEAEEKAENLELGGTSTGARWACDESVKL